MEKKKKGGKLKYVLLVLIVLGLIIYKATDFITDYLWFKELGYVSVFFTEIMTKLKLGIPLFVITTAVGFVFLSLLKRNFLKKSDMELSDSESAKTMRTVVIILSGVFGAVLTAVTISKLWFQILQFLNATDFNITDPLFGLDLSFYMFKLEFWTQLNSASMNIIVSLIGLTVVFYALLMSFASAKAGATGHSEADTYDYDIPSEDPIEPEESKAPESFSDAIEGFFKARANNSHKKQQKKQDRAVVGKALLNVASTEIIVLGFLLFGSIAFGFFLRQYDLLYGGTGVAYGAGYTDMNVTLNIYRALIVLSVLSAILLVAAIKKRKLRLALICPVLMIVISLGGAGAANLVQSVIVSPDEISKESQYLKNNIEFTQMAYDLQDIAVKDFSPQNNLTMADVLNNMDTFSNIRINDFEPAEQFYNQTQSIRTYYTFNDVDVDRYNVNGEYTQVFLSAREIDQNKVEDQWLIKHLKYTHGYGITLSRVDRITSSGQPDMLIDSIPPVSDVPEITIGRPEIYFGESTNEYIITGTDEDEFDYPSGESNTYCKYEGDAGISLNLFNRALFAIREKSLKLMVSTNISSDSKILIYRNIKERVNKIAPFLAYDDDPYVVTVDGQIYWIMDAYTLSAYYPYSEPWSKESDMNYIRNSVKVVINAYDGDVSFYMVDDRDPLAVTLGKIYPDLFKPFADMPESLKSHIQYPNSLFNIQANVYKKYHMDDVEVFYQNEDLWAISNELYNQSERQMTPNYFIMKLPGESQAEFVSSIPYTPSGKSNMSGILMARNDGEYYGQLVLYRMPKDRIIYGPAQIEAQINQDADISKEFSLWNNSGSTYSRGNMFAFPVEGSLLYVEPVYLEASSGSLPEVKRVIIYYGDKVAYEPTLAEALDSLFGTGAGAPLLTDNPIEEGKKAASIIVNGGTLPQTPTGDIEDGQGTTPPATTDIKQLAQLANDAYEQALKAMSNGDWAGYGKYMDQLADYLKSMAEQ